MIPLKKLLVIGGGITGLAAAYYAKEKIREKNLPYKVKLVEASEKLGGKIETTHRDGFTIERGPDSFLARKQPAVDLIEQLGLQDELVRNATGLSYILVKNKLHKIPPGSFMGVPVEARPFVFSRLFSLRGKLRATGDYIIPKSKEHGDQSLGKFFRRRFGDELVEHLIEPLLSGIYSGDVDEMSLQATFPNFYALEQKHGSLIRGLQKAMPKRSKKKQQQGAFYALKGGFQSLVDALEKELQHHVTKGIAVDHIEKKDHYYHVLYSDGTVDKIDTMIVTTPHTSLEHMFSKYDGVKELKTIPTTSVANVALAFDEQSLRKDIDGTGFVVSRKSDFRITACTWTHRKWPHTTPKGQVLLRSYVGGADDREAAYLTDEELVDIVLRDLRKIMNITGSPNFSVITRFQKAMPQYVVGHLERVEKVESYLQENLPGVYLAGASYRGVGVPDCIAQGKKAVTEAISFLQQTE
ncbi:MAG TPA: protoporphyrinogen oxidase [Pseudogracilibacillus sp.]|nr:protoporphyrinogen oxidase [Pseudogracilibacillus sp.]